MHLARESTAIRVRVRSRIRFALSLVVAWCLTSLCAVGQNSFSLTATPTVLSPSGGVITFTVALDYSNPVSAIALKVVAPNAGWTYTATGGTNVPQIVPRAGDTGASGDGFGFLYIIIPARRPSYTLSLQYPAKLTEPQLFQASATLTSTAGLSTVLNNDLTLGPAPTTPPTQLAPTITTQPTDLNATSGSTATFSVMAAGTGPLLYQWRKGGVNITGGTASILTLTAVKAADAATYDVLVSNAAGRITSRAARLDIPAAASILPTIGTQPQNTSIAVSSTTTFSVSTTASSPPAFLWQRLPAGSTTWSALANTNTYAGVTTATLTVRTATLAMNGDLFRCVLTNGTTSVTSAAAVLTVTPPPTEAPDAKLINLSVRANTGTGDQVLLVGFVISGGGSKQVLVRGIGPALTQFGISGPLSDPMLTLFNGASTEIGSNDNWGGTTALSKTFTQVGAFSLPISSKDSVLSMVLPSGACSAKISGSAGGTGLSLAEVYDADPKGPPARFINLAARNQVGSGDGLLVVGFVIDGTTNDTVLIRGIGPTLSQFGVGGALTDPQIKLFNQKGQQIQENDNWGGSEALAAAFTKTGAFALQSDSKDAALLVSLPPGAYTAQVSGVTNATGIALVEVYEVR